MPNNMATISKEFKKFRITTVIVETKKIVREGLAESEEAALKDGIQFNSYDDSRTRSTIENVKETVEVTEITD